MEDPAPRSAPPGARIGPLAFLYDGVLGRLEQVVLGVLLTAVIVLSFVEILNRNLDLALWEAAATNRITFSLVFYIGLFGAVVATRQARHIAIDAVTPYLPPRARAAVSGALLLASAVACAWITMTARRYVTDVIGPDDRFLPDKVAWYWRDRLWKQPLVVAFALMTLHFAVAGATRLVAAARGGRALDAQEPSA